MGRYINYNEVVDRYASVAEFGTEEISSSYIAFAEYELDARLSKKFSVPFSSNNMTIKDLAIDMTYIRLSRLAGNNYDSGNVKESVKERIAMLLSGEMLMVTTSDDTIGKSDSSIWVGMNYKPSFDMQDNEVRDVTSGRLAFDEDNGE